MHSSPPRQTNTSQIAATPNLVLHRLFAACRDCPWAAGDCPIVILMGEPEDDLAHGLADAVRRTTRRARHLGRHCAPRCPAVCVLDVLDDTLAPPSAS